MRSTWSALAVGAALLWIRGCPRSLDEGADQPSPTDVAGATEDDGSRDAGVGGVADAAGEAAPDGGGGGAAPEDGGGADDGVETAPRGSDDGGNPADGEGVAAAAGTCTEVPRDLPLEERCAMAGAEVHQFPNTCVGGCRAVEEAGMMCGQALTMGCKCPEGRCIDENSGCCRPIKR